MVPFHQSKIIHYSPLADFTSHEFATIVKPKFVSILMDGYYSWFLEVSIVYCGKKFALCTEEITTILKPAVIDKALTAAFNGLSKVLISKSGRYGAKLNQVKLIYNNTFIQ